MLWARGDRERAENPTPAEPSWVFDTLARGSTRGSEVEREATSELRFAGPVKRSPFKLLEPHARPGRPPQGSCEQTTARLTLIGCTPVLIGTRLRAWHPAGNPAGNQNPAPHTLAIWICGRSYQTRVLQPLSLFLSNVRPSSRQLDEPGIVWSIVSHARLPSDDGAGATLQSLPPPIAFPPHAHQTNTMTKKEQEAATIIIRTLPISGGRVGDKNSPEACVRASQCATVRARSIGIEAPASDPCSRWPSSRNINGNARELSCTN